MFLFLYNAISVNFRAVVFPQTQVLLVFWFQELSPFIYIVQTPTVLTASGPCALWFPHEPRYGLFRATCLIPEPVAAEWTSMRRVSMSCGMGRIWHFVESSTVCSTGRFSLNRGTNRRGNTNPGLFQSCIIVHLVGFLRPVCSGLPYWMYLHLEQFISKAFSGIRLGGTPVPIFA